MLAREVRARVLEIKFINNQTRATILSNLHADGGSNLNKLCGSY